MAHFTWLIIVCPSDCEFLSVGKNTGPTVGPTVGSLLLGFCFLAFPDVRPPPIHSFILHRSVYTDELTVVHPTTATVHICLLTDAVGRARHAQAADKHTCVCVCMNHLLCLSPQSVFTLS